MKKIILSLIIISMSITPVFANEYKLDKNEVYVYTNREYLSSNNDVAWAWIDTIQNYRDDEPAESVVFLRPGFATITDLQTGKKFNFEVSGTARTDEIALKHDLIESWVGSGSTDKEKLENVFRYFYDNGFTYDFYETSKGLLTSRTGQCGQYSEIVKYLCDKIGIPCSDVQGYNSDYSSSAHRWNYCYLDGHYYEVDLCNYIMPHTLSNWKEYGLTRCIQLIE